MNKAQVNGMRGQSRTWSSTIVNTPFFTECEANSVSILNPHLIVGYYHLWGMPLFMNLDFDADAPLVVWDNIYPNTQSLPFDGMNYASNYAYSPFSSFTQTKAGGSLPAPPDPIAPLTLSNYDYTIGEQFFYWYKTIDTGMSKARGGGVLTPNNPFMKTTTYHDEIAINPVTSINNNFSSFSAFNFIDMLDESYCDISKYFVHNQTTAWGGIGRTLDSAVLTSWQNEFQCGDFLIQIMYLDRGHGFEFERTLIP